MVCVFTFFLPPSIQSWVKQQKAVSSMAHIAALKRVYVGLSDGTVYAYSDDLASPPSSGGFLPSKVRLSPLAEYNDNSQSSACLLAVAQGHKNDTNMTFELWVGQKRGVITILDADTLNVIKFVRTTMDMSKVPSYIPCLSYTHLVCGSSPDYSAGEGGVVRGCGTVYAALHHGQFVSRWDTVNKKEVDCLNCQEKMDDPSQGTHSNELRTCARTHHVHTYTLSVHTLSVHTLSIHTLSIHTLSVHTLSIHTLSIHTLSIHTLSVHTLSIHTLSIHTLSIHIYSNLHTVVLIHIYTVDTPHH